MRTDLATIARTTLEADIDFKVADIDSIGNILLIFSGCSFPLAASANSPSMSKENNPKCDDAAKRLLMPQVFTKSCGNNFAI